MVIYLLLRSKLQNYFGHLGASSEDHLKCKNSGKSSSPEAAQLEVVVQKQTHFNPRNEKGTELVGEKETCCETNILHAFSSLAGRNSLGILLTEYLQ